MSNCKCGEEQVDSKPMEVCDNCKAVLKISKSDFVNRLNQVIWRINTDHFKHALNGLEELKEQVI